MHVVFWILWAFVLLVLFLAAFTGIVTAERQRPKRRKAPLPYPNEGEQIGETLCGLVMMAGVFFAIWYYVLAPFLKFIDLL